MKRRLSQLSSRIKPLAPSVGYLADDYEARRRATVPWRAWYHTPEWRAIRREVLRAAKYTCARCGLFETDTSKLHADHIEPHRGDRAKFFDRDNVQCLCVTCHVKHKQKEEHAARL